MNEKINEKDVGVELKLQDLLMACLRKWKLIAICVLIGCTIAWGVTFFCMTPMYRATASVYVNNTADANKQGLTSSDVSASIFLIKSYQVLAESDQILTETAQKLGDSYTALSLSGTVSTTHIDNTMILILNVSHSDPYEAERIANALAITLENKGPELFKGTFARVIDTASVPTSPYSPNYTTNILTGAAAGALLAILYAVIAFMKDTRIKDENDLTDMFNLPILGRIPNFNDAVTGTRYAETDDEGGEDQ